MTGKTEEVRRKAMRRELTHRGKLFCFDSVWGEYAMATVLNNAKKRILWVEKKTLK
jgi:hypothetical protein